MNASSKPTADSLNSEAFKLCLVALKHPEWLNIIERRVGKAQVIDFATQRSGTTEAGLLLARISMGGAGTVDLRDCTEESAPADGLQLPQVHVATSAPLAACIGAQYAGWPISSDDFFAMGSGPMRLRRGKEPILLEYDLPATGRRAVGVLESNELPTGSVVQQIADQCGVSLDQLCLCVARTASYPGSIQVVARSIETAMHKLHELNFDLETIVKAQGQAPLPPLAPDDLTALGWTNDAMLYGAKVHLTVDTRDEAIEKIIDQIPSSSSAEFGTPFLEIFEKYDRDFYKIDKMLFSPAEVTLVNQSTGRKFHMGAIRNDILKRSYGLQ